ncbi:MAG: DUF4162 domain-containing protein, partial [Saprospiraceae bacterium]
QFKEHLFQIDYNGELPKSLTVEDETNDSYQILERKDNQLIIKVEHDKASNELLNYLMQNSVYINGFKEILPSLNEIFIKQVEK